MRRYNSIKIKDEFSYNSKKQVGNAVLSSV